MIINGIWIDKDTLSTVRPVPDPGKADCISFRLTIYDNCKIVFEKDYKTETGAAIANTKLLRKYHNI